MTHLGLFEGIGGFSLAAKWMGWETLAWCEWNEFGQKVLRHHFPEAEGFGDITKTDFTKYANRIDILTGGFPCQPFSTAGERKGVEDERYLWPEMLRTIREVQPRWVVGENVHGIINWSKGMVIKQIQFDLEDAGYKLMPPIVLPASAVNADHRRDRTWFIAYSMQRGLQTNEQRLRAALPVHAETSNQFNRCLPKRWEIRHRNIGEIRGGYGVPKGLDDSTISEGRIISEGIAAYGNAIVPQVAFEIFKIIAAFKP